MSFSPIDRSSLFWSNATGYNTEVRSSELQAANFPTPLSHSVCLAYKHSVVEAFSGGTPVYLEARRRRERTQPRGGVRPLPAAAGEPWGTDMSRWPASQELVVESIDLQRVRPPTRWELVGSHLRGDRLYGEVVSSRRPTLAVRSEIGPYRRPSPRYLALPKIVRDATPMKSPFPSTDGASQVRRSEGAADVCIPASAYPDARG